MVERGSSGAAPAARPPKRAAATAIVSASGNGAVQSRAEAMGRLRVGPLPHFEEYGRLQFIALLRLGLMPDSAVIDVGCGALRAGYWLIHFLDAGRYLGIEPAVAMVEAARTGLLEPGLEAEKRPRFAHNADLDLSVFGVQPNFVLARSVWSHTSKPQIEAMLDSFAAVAAPGGLMLTSYLPAMRHPRRPPDTSLRGRALAMARRGLGRGPRQPTSGYWGRVLPDYTGDKWSPNLISHDAAWIAAQCNRRGLAARESMTDGFGYQVWLEITRA